MTTIQTHVYIGFANPFLVCDTCGEPVPYWHDPTRCGVVCVASYYNVPCEHPAGISSKCMSWGPVDGCRCETPCKK